MAAVYDTEIEEVEKAVSQSTVRKSTSLDKDKSIFQESMDSFRLNALDDSTEYESLQPTDSIVMANNEPKTFDQSGYEVSVVFCLAVIIGLMLWQSLSKRWHI